MLMKIKGLLKGIVLLVVAVGLSASLTSCDTDDYWYDGPGWNDGTFNDPDLGGYWALVQINSENVSGYDMNYLYFNGRGRGEYYYWDNGRRYVMPTYYNSQYSGYGGDTYQINLQYGNDRPTTMNYWFTHGGNTLWFQWNEYGRTTTYVYDRINSAPW